MVYVGILYSFQTFRLSALLEQMKPPSLRLTPHSCRLAPLRATPVKESDRIPAPRVHGPLGARAPSSPHQVDSRVRPIDAPCVYHICRVRGTTMGALLQLYCACIHVQLACHLCMCTPVSVCMQGFLLFTPLLVTMYCTTLANGPFTAHVL